MAGPVISSTLYALLGFRMTFFIYGGSEVVFALIIRLCLKETTPQDANPEKQDKTLNPTQQSLLRKS